MAEITPGIICALEIGGWHNSGRFEAILACDLARFPSSCSNATADIEPVILWQTITTAPQRIASWWRASESACGLASVNGFCEGKSRWCGVNWRSLVRQGFRKSIGIIGV